VASPWVDQVRGHDEPELEGKHRKFAVRQCSGHSAATNPVQPRRPDEEQQTSIPFPLWRQGLERIEGEIRIHFERPPDGRDREGPAPLEANWPAVPRDAICVDKRVWVQGDGKNLVRVLA